MQNFPESRIRDKQCRIHNSPEKMHPKTHSGQPEVFQEVEDGGEPEVLDPALPVRVDGETQVLSPALHISVPDYVKPGS
jgi:hypothetical protein